MARLNIEDSLFDDKRFIKLAALFNSKIKAIGWWVVVAKVAQSYWKDGKEHIPESIYKYNKIPKEFIESGLIEKTEFGYYLAGSEENFAWISSKVANGKKGGRPPQVIETKEEGLTYAESYGKATDNPLTLPLSLSQSNTNICEPSVVPSVDRFIDCWNQMAKQAGLPRSVKLKPEFRAKAKKVMEELETEENLIAALVQVPQNPFNLGKTGGKWKANIVWFLKSGKAIELLEQSILEKEIELKNAEYLQ
jgi:hypothetical protein